MLRVRALFGLGLVISAWLAAPAGAEAIRNQDCLECHSETIHSERFASSIHGQNLCTSCHQGIAELPHETPLPKVDCAQCHRIESEIYNNSDHGRARAVGAPAAACADCHGDPHVLVNVRDAASPVHRTRIAQTCASCHEDADKMKPYDLLVKEPYASYLQTIHGVAFGRGEINSATCTDCHGSHDLHAPTNPESKIHRSRVPETCGKCHENILQTYQRSVHGKAALSGKVEAPICTDCHGEHNILSHWDPASRTYATSISEKVCSSCHEAERIVTKYRLPSDRLKTYRESYHGLANQYGVTTVANCASCHGAHDVLPSSDPHSSVYRDNLARTCGKCHPNAGEQLSKGVIHLAPSPVRDRAVYFVTVFYWFLLVTVLGGMLLHNTLDFAKKLRLHYRKRAAGSPHARFSLAERLQHWLLVLSFVVLVYTGFALKFHDSWWALPLTVRSGDVDWRGVVHRAAAVLFTLLCLYHLGYVALTRRGRLQLGAMLPRLRDFKDLGRNLAYYLGRTDRRAHFARYGYVEKAEYWALVWGAVIMIVTGAVLTFADWSLKFLPKWAMDVATTIHYYEAVLATLAIVIWHFYFTIFDPEQYPMNWSMITGKSDHDPGDEKSPSSEPDRPAKP